MNDKQKQIEEMAKVIFEYVDSKDRKNVYIVHSGVAEDMKTYCHNYGVAKDLYNANCRILDEGSVILSKEENEARENAIDSLQVAISSFTRLETLYKIKCKELEIAEEQRNQARKETASEIFETLIEVCKRGYVLHLDTLIANAKRFGVEIKE